MNRDEALLKLLAVEPETRDQLIAITGWPAEETSAVLDRLVAEQRVGYGEGPYGAHGRRLYHPKGHAYARAFAEGVVNFHQLGAEA